MKKTGKIILIVLSILVVVYAIFVFADSKRLEKSENGTKPIITISEDKENHSFTGLGYTIKYYLNEGETEYKNAYGAECRLFGKILLWAYVVDKDENEKVPNKGSGWVYPPMIMVDGELYLDTGYRNDMAKCAVMNGEIKSEVNSDQRPTENDQSNFGKGYGYQFGEEGTIEVLIDGKWVIFATEEKREEIQFGKPAMTRMVKLNGKLYYDTFTKCEQPSCVVVGEIKSEVERTEIPTENDQSNFGKGYPYQFDEDGTIAIVWTEDGCEIFATDDLSGFVKGYSYQFD